MPAARRRGCRQSRSVASTLTRSSRAGTTLTDLNTAVANTSTTTVTGMPPMMSGTPSLPTDVTVRPAASHCAALRSGTYRILTPRTHTTMTDQYDQGLFAGLRVSATIDAAGVLNATLCGDPSSVLWDTTTCQALPAGTLALRANADDGFDMVDEGSLGGRVFACRAGGGEWMVLEVDDDGASRS